MGRMLGGTIGWLIACTMAFGGCLAEPEQVSIPVRVEGAPADLTLDEGRVVRLTQASLTLGDLLLEGPSPSIAWRPSLLPVAYAHPGHGGVGDVRGELRGAWGVDLLGGGAELGPATLFEGDFAAARLHVMPDTAVRIEGDVLVGERWEPFAFALDVHEEVAGIPFDMRLDALSPPDSLVIGVDLAEALSHLDWSGVQAGEAGLEDDEAAASVRFGLVSTNTWTLSWE